MTNKSDFTKSECRLLREATGYAWEAELGAKLAHSIEEYKRTSLRKAEDADEG